jgi:hypothetical protein
MSFTIDGQATRSSSLMEPLPPALRSSWLSRQILWLQSKQNTWENENERLFYDQAIKAAQPPCQHFPLKTKTHTFNHINFYILHENIIWYKPISDSGRTWKPIYFEGFPRGILPERIQADGANLIIMAKQEIYYKKVLTEHRDRVTQEYTFKDISEQNNWIPTWLTLPVVKYLQNPFADNHLKLPKDYIGFAISNRAEHCGKVEDGLGIEHLNPLNITSLYVLMKTHILLFDPYVNIGANFELPLPETKDSSFEGLSIQASGSTILLIGYEIKPKEKGVAKSLKIITGFKDHDLLGNNPVVSYDFKVNAPKPQSFMLPMPDWMEHSYPGTMTKKGTILQTGAGNRARELRIPGWNTKKEEGYFKKAITEKEWQFIPYPHGYSKKKTLSVYLEDDGQEFKTTIRDYPQGTLVNAQLPPDRNISLSLRHFGKNTFSSTIELQINELRLNLLLYRTNGVLNFIFPTLSPQYQLVLPPLDSLTDEQQKMVRAIFHNVTPVTIMEEKDSLKIIPNFLTGLYFEISLHSYR